MDTENVKKQVSVEGEQSLFLPPAINGDREGVHHRSDDNAEETNHEHEDDLILQKKHKHRRLPKQPPKDRLNGAYIIFFLQGIGMLFPWNIFINASTYFAARFKESPYENTFENYFSICFMGSNCIFLVVSVAVQHRIPLRVRITLPLVVNMVIFIVTMVMVQIENVAADTLFIVTMVCIFICGWMTAFLQGGIFGLAGQFAGKYTQAVMSGQGIAGVTVSVTALITVAAEPATGKPPPYSTVAASATAYFAVSVVILVASLIGYVVLEKLKVTQYYRDKFHIAEVKEKRRLKKVAEQYAQEQERKLNKGTTAERASLLTSPGGTVDEPALGIKKESGRMATIFKQIWPFMLTVFFIFFTTLSLFPSITEQIQSVNNPTNVPAPKAGRFYGDIFVPFQFLLFNLGDWGGRMASGAKRRPPPIVLYIVAAVRACFFPLFMLSNVSYSLIDPVFNSDVYPMIFMVVFSFSNGYFSSLAMMYGPDRVKDAHKDAAGATMVLFLTIGLSCGSMFSFLLTHLLCQCNPFNPTGGEAAAS